MRSLWIFFFACLFFAFAGCAGNKPAVSTESPAGAEPAAVRDRLRAKFVLTLVDTAGKTQELDAVLFSVPGKRYRMELTGPMGVGVASLLWTESGWDIVFPTEKKFLHGVGYMVGVLNNDGVLMVPIHQVADLFDGILVPERMSVLEELDSAGFHVVKGKATSGMNFTYGQKDGQVAWLSRAGVDGRPEILRYSDFRTFENVPTPEFIVFERDGKMFLKIRIKKVTRGKAFSPGTWRLNIPKSYKSIEG